jgi:hypothetical protein
VFSRFSHLKAKEDALKAIEKGIGTELRTFTNHLQTVQLSYDIIQKQTLEILQILKEKK